MPSTNTNSHYVALSQHRTRHEPPIPMFDELGRAHGVSLDVEEAREWSPAGGWSFWTPCSHTMRCEGDTVVQDAQGRYRLVQAGLLLHPPASEQ